MGIAASPFRIVSPQKEEERSQTEGTGASVATALGSRLDKEPERFLNFRRSGVKNPSGVLQRTRKASHHSLVGWVPKGTGGTRSYTAAGPGGVSGTAPPAPIRRPLRWAPSRPDGTMLRLARTHEWAKRPLALAMGSVTKYIAHC
jgi:hypothetical protein